MWAGVRSPDHEPKEAAVVAALCKWPACAFQMILMTGEAQWPGVTWAFLRVRVDLQARVEALVLTEQQPSTMRRTRDGGAVLEVLFCVEGPDCFAEVVVLLELGQRGPAVRHDAPWLVDLDCLGHWCGSHHPHRLAS